MFDLTGKISLVTGASGGIGCQIARTLHSRGATVVLSGTRAEALQKLADELGSRAFIAPCNLSDSSAVEALIPKVEKMQGGLDILVNNAGITRDMLTMRMKDEDWQSVIDVNLTSTFKLCRAAMKIMLRKKSGRIITITSVVGVMGNAGQANYAAAKAGLIGMSKSMAQEAASRNITVNCIAPGFIETPMTDVLNEQQKEGIMGKVPAGKLGKPEDIAAATVYLASDEASYITGQTLHVNGGMIMI